MNGNANFSLSYSTAFDWAELPPSFNATGFAATVGPFPATPLAGKTLELDLLPATGTQVLFTWDEPPVASPGGSSGTQAASFTRASGIIAVTTDKPNITFSFLVPPAAAR